MSRDLNRDFDHHPPRDDAEAAEHADVRSEFKALASAIEVKVPPGREQALAFTKLEEAMFWANAALARRRYDDEVAD